ncbi:MAG TPA: hypothetical protein VEA69_24105 [Tepidisphaeraceae bacterium]|nr:hypothetical protein [Tepidisphaeraceae bacterium]
MTTIRILTYIGIVLAVWLALIDYAVMRPKRKALPGARLRGFEGLVYLGFLGCVLLMSVSSFGMIAVGEHMHRWMLIVHMSVAPPYAVCLTILALMWAEQSQFRGERAAESAALGERFYPGEKLAFWVTVAAGFVTIATAMLGMMTWFGSDGQIVLLNTHRIAALVVLVSAVFHGTRVLLGRPAAAVE